MKKRPLLIALGVLVALLLVGGCVRLHRLRERLSPPAVPATAVHSIPVGRSTQSIQIGSLTRTFHIYRPAHLKTPASLVVMLHGGFGNGTQAEQAYGWDAEADRNGFLVVYPDGVRRAWNVDGGGCCGKPADDHVDDVGFITQMVAALKRETRIDSDRVYATGISNGGILSYTLACRTTLFAAIGPDSATELSDCPGPAPISVIHIHGTADERIPTMVGAAAARRTSTAQQCRPSTRSGGLSTAAPRRRSPPGRPSPPQLPHAPVGERLS